MDIVIENLYKKYDNLSIFENFSLTIRNNKIFCLFGPSGCGKTTLLNMIAGLENYDGGNIKGIENKKISYIFQETRLLPWASVYENISFVLKSTCSKDETEKLVNKYLKLVSLKEYKDYYPNQLSGGMEQRVSIARCFAYKSDIILMDEPFKGLDLKLKENLMKDFRELWKENKPTVIFVTHDKEEAKYLADEVFYFGS